jgi:hypothetical protein
LAAEGFKLAFDPATNRPSTPLEKAYLLSERVTLRTLLCWQDSSGPRFYVPAAADLRELIISEHHDIGIAGHLGVNRTLSFLRRQYYWPGMKQMVRDCIRSCEYCQRNKSSNTLPAGLLQSLPLPAKRWDSISMDFITHLPSNLVNGFDSVLTIVDRLSKMVRYIPTTTTASAADVARLVFDNVVCLFGVPLDIVSDRDPKFVSKFWEELWSLFGTKLSRSTAYHPQTDGQSEIMNRFLNDYLRNFCADHADWLQHLKVAVCLQQLNPWFYWLFSLFLELWTPS